MWEVAPARLSDGSIVDLWRNETAVAWAVRRGDEPPRRRGRWRAFPYTAEREPAAERAFWGALCDEWERFDAAGRTVVGFHFYMLQADAKPLELVQNDQRERVPGDQREGDGGAAEARPIGYDEGLYGEVTKRLIKRFNCAERPSLGS